MLSPALHAPAASPSKGERKPGAKRDIIYVYRVALGDLGQRLAGRATLDGFFALVVGELGLATELDASGLGALTAVACAFADQVALKLSYGREKC
jgi:hypothetical protein